MKVFKELDAISESIKYFDGDELAATTWVNKYALRNAKGELLENSPKMMHDRLIKEILRIEKKFDNSVINLSKELLEELFYNFKYFVFGGSSMSGLGNNYKFSSLSNCFVIDPPLDSYGGIFKADQELVQLMKRRGGVGIDLSYLRPADTKVTNDAKTSSGVVSFMERYSNSTREVGQQGRRGALMISISVNHPDSDKFIDAKMQEGKITGANVSVKVTDEFMKAVKDNQHFAQVFPVDENIWELVDFRDDPYNCYELNGKALELDKLYEGKKPGTYVKIIDAKKLFKKLVYNNWKSAEPGCLFWDKIKSESPADFYDDYQTVSTNPCGEIPLCPNDSCRLFAINLFSYVENPFSKESTINYAKLAQHSKYAMIIMDDLIECEAEHITDIINKIKSDPEPDEVKATELALWNKILKKTTEGRRTGIGITALGDMLAALNVKYGSEESFEIVKQVLDTISSNVYMSSIDLAHVRGAFKVWNSNEIKFDDIYKNSEYIKRMYNKLPKDYKELWNKTGRRNIACLTIAPTGTVSLMTQTTSGIEPLFKAWYIRRRKTNDKSKATFTDNVGDMFEEFKVFHPKFIEWYRSGYRGGDNLMYGYKQAYDILNSLPEESLQKIYEESPWYLSTAQDINWINKVQLQGLAQTFIDHSISCTVNLPKDTTVDLVNDLYMEAWKSGCKGITIYRDGSRDGVLVTKSDKKSEVFSMNTPRPKELHSRIVRFKNGNENWIAFIGLMNGHPYEIFCGKVDDDIRYLPKSITEGKIVRVDTGAEVNGKIPHRYDFIYDIGYGYENALPCINDVFKSEYWNYARLISSMLRAGIPLVQVINVINGLNSDMGDIINTWKKGVARALKTFVADGEISLSKCPKCGTNLVFQGGCMICPACGESKCE